MPGGRLSINRGGIRLASGTPQYTAIILRMLLMVSGIVLLPACPTLWSKAGGDAVDGGHALDWLFGF